MAKREVEGIGATEAPFWGDPERGVRIIDGVERFLAAIERAPVIAR